MKRGEIIWLLTFIVLYVTVITVLYCGMFLLFHGKLPPWSR